MCCVYLVVYSILIFGQSLTEGGTACTAGVQVYNAKDKQQSKMKKKEKKSCTTYAHTAFAALQQKVNEATEQSEPAHTTHP